MTRGEIWFAEVGRRRRPVVVLTRPEVIDVRALVTVAEVTASIRDIDSEVGFDHEAAGLDRPSVINCDGPCTITRTSLTTYVGAVSEATTERVCAAVGCAIDCWGDVASARRKEACDTRCDVVPLEHGDRASHVLVGALEPPARLVKHVIRELLRRHGGTRPSLHAARSRARAR